MATPQTLSMYPNAELVVAILANVDVSGLTSLLPFHIADEILGLHKSQDWLNEDAIEASAGLNGIVAERRKMRPFRASPKQACSP